MQLENSKSFFQKKIYVNAIRLYSSETMKNICESETVI